MANLTSVNDVPLSDLLNNVALYRYNPTNIQRVILDHLSKVTNGEVDIVDPTNPFIFLLEASCVNAASNNIESEVNLRKQYSVLAQSTDDLYIHMSDKDFNALFATPSSTTFTWMIQYSSLLGQMIESPSENCYRATIARNAEVVVDTVKFSLQYPIDIRLFPNGILQVSYDNSKSSPLQVLNTNIIPFKLVTDASGVQWLKFSVEMSQFNIISSFYTVQASSIFQQSVNYNDAYYCSRVFYRKGGTLAWTEMLTSLTDQVYDPLKPTAIIQPNDQTKTLNVFIPPVYVTSNLIDGDIRIDVYETKGALQLDTSNYTFDVFKVNLIAVDEDNDTTVFTNAMNDVSLLAYSANFVSGGSAALDFETLRAQVINNAIGSVNIPITNVQLVSEAAVDGFTLVKNVDLITNRSFLATKALPAPTNGNLITSANLSIETFSTSMEQLALTDTVSVNANRVTILSETVFTNNNGKLSIVPRSTIETVKKLPLSTLCTTVNEANYLYSPFHYVLDNSQNEFIVRAYHLDAPTASDLSFISQNSTAALQVNTQNYSIEKTTKGYRLVVEVSSDAFYKELDDQYVQVQLCFLPVGEVDKAYINGQLYGKNATTGERIFTFDLESNWDVDTKDNLIFTNLKMFSNELSLTSSLLSQTFNLLWATNSVPSTFVRDASTAELGKFLLPSDTVAITKETLVINFGKSLENLWTRSRSVAAGNLFETYAADVPMVYETDIYQKDPVTGATVSFDASGNPVVTLLHKANDPVLDAQGQVVYKNRVGDVKLDIMGKPIAISDIYTERMVDIVLVDGAYFFATDIAYGSYRKEIASVLNTWITSTLANIQSRLLEKTEVYFYPTRAIGLVDVSLSQDISTQIESRQSFAVTLYVNSTVFHDTKIRAQLSNSAIKTLNTCLKNTVVSIDDIVEKLKFAFGNTVISVNLSGLGGAKNYNTVTLLNEHEGLSLNKHLQAQDDGTLIVTEAVDIQFIEYTA